MRYVGFSRLCYVIKLFPELNIYFLTNGITFPLSYSEWAIEWRQYIIPGLNKYVQKLIQIDMMTTKLLIFFSVDYSFKRASDTMVIYEHIFQRQHQLIKNCWSPYVKITVTYIILIYWELFPSFITFILSVNYMTWNME